MIAISHLTDALGSGLLTLLHDPTRAEVDDVVIAELGHPTARPGDVVLGVGVTEVAHAVQLVQECAAAGAPGVVLRRRIAGRRRVREASAQAGITVVALAEQASWAHVVWLLRGAIDRSAAHDEPASDPPVHDDLFGLADAVATLVEGPVTIEDARSRVLAYSARQDMTDEARVSTIIGRRVPEALLASYRSGGVFRRLANSSDPFLLPASADGHVRARYVVPVRAGQEWLGSIWAVTDTVPPPRIARELASTASVVALHLLRLRSRSDLSQQVVAERLRQALTGVSSDARRWLPPGPWRVVALGSGSAAGMWESLLRRRSWNAPLVVELDGRGYAVVTDEGRAQDAGSWLWLRRVVEALSADGEPVLVGAGRVVRHPAQLPISRAEALEALVAWHGAPGASAVATIEEAWAQVTIDRAAHGLGSDPVLGPLQALAEHDSSQGSDYLPTLLAWLDHPGEARLAAAELHIHPNTLRYRMGRIQELAGCDFAHRDTRLALHLQLRALQVADAVADG